MKRLFLLLALLLSAGAMLNACGGDSEEPLDQDTIAAAADEICAETNALYDDFGVRGLTNFGLVGEFEATARVRDEFASEFEGLDVDESVTDWERYVDLNDELGENDLEIAAAGKKDDTEAVNAAFESRDKLIAERDELASNLGFEVCGKVPPIELEPTGTGPAEDLAFAEPRNSVEQAADAYLAAGGSGNCAEFNKQRHTDAGTIDQATCKNVAVALNGGKVAETETYGPVGMAEIVGSQGTHYPTFFVVDLDGNLRYAGDAVHDSGGLRPAPEGNDADETIEAVVNSIRDGDSEAFNATISDPENSVFITGEDGFETIGEGEFSGQFISDIRDSDVKAEPLGINSTYAFYLVEGTEYDWVVNLIHTPGDQKQYRLSGYFPIPKPE